MNKSKVFAGVGVTALVAACVVSAYTVLNANNDQPVSDNSNIPVSGESIVIKDDDRNYLLEIQDKVDKGMIQVRMTQNWIFKDGGKTSNAFLANSERNTTDLRFQIYRADTGEILMTSPNVPVGSCIEDFPLSVELEPGVYNIVVAHQQVEGDTVINEVRTSGVITVR